MHFLLTGHTGFKGSWLTLLLTELGHTVSGVALDPTPTSLFAQAHLTQYLSHDIRADIRDAATMTYALKSVRPDVLIHMAAQPLVRESYARPRVTVETNVIGTLNVLEAAGASDSLQAILIVTTDKVYRDAGLSSGYMEKDPLGGEDLYSASKAMADLLTQSWISSFVSPPSAVVRAGNVIGGGDYSKDRLLPDLVNALSRRETVQLRYPSAVRPWQHVLDCLNGYLMVVEHLLNAGESDSCGLWNIGPGEGSLVTVAEVASLVGRQWGSELLWESSDRDDPKETSVLTLDASKANIELGWENQLNFASAIEWTTNWYFKVAQGQDPLEVSLQQIRDFIPLVTAFTTAE